MQTVKFMGLVFVLKGGIKNPPFSFETSMSHGSSFRCLNDSFCARMDVQIRQKKIICYSQYLHNIYMRSVNQKTKPKPGSKARLWILEL